MARLNIDIGTSINTSGLRTMSRQLNNLRADANRRLQTRVNVDVTGTRQLTTTQRLINALQNRNHINLRFTANNVLQTAQRTVQRLRSTARIMLMQFKQNGLNGVRGQVQRLQSTASNMVMRFRASGLSSISRQANRIVDTLDKLKVPAIAATTATTAGTVPAAITAQQADLKIQQQLGLKDNDKSLKELQNAARKLYQNGTAESYDEASNMVVQLRKLLNVSTGDIDSYAKQIKMIANVQGSDFDEMTSAILKSSKGFGQSYKQVMSSMYSTSVAGVDQDTLDSYSEFSSSLKQLGMDSQQAGNLFAASKKMFLNSDVGANILNEMRINLTNGDADTRKALAAIGLSYSDLEKQMSDGRGVQATVTILKALQQQDSKTRQTLGAKLMSSYYEDYGDTVLKLTDILGKDIPKAHMSAKESADKTAQSNKTMIDSLKQSAIDNLVPLGNAILDLLSGPLKGLTKILQWTADFLNTNPIVSTLTAGFMFFGTAVTTVVKPLRTVWRLIGGWSSISRVLAPGIRAFRSLIPILGRGGIWGWVIAIGLSIASLFIDWQKVWSGIKKISKNTYAWLSKVTSNTIGGLKSAFKSVRGSASSVLSKMVGIIYKPIQSGIKIAKKAINGIKSTFNAVREYISGIISKIKKTISNIFSVKLKVPDWLKKLDKKIDIPFIDSGSDKKSSKKSSSHSTNKTPVVNTRIQIGNKTINDYITNTSQSFLNSLF